MEWSAALHRFFNPILVVAVAFEVVLVAVVLETVRGAMLISSVQKRTVQRGMREGFRGK